jgi:probable HAF family extracellular repeat protein
MRIFARHLIAVAATGISAAATIAGAGPADAAPAVTAPQYRLVLSSNLVDDYLGVNARGDVIGLGAELGSAVQQGFIQPAGTTTLGFLGAPGDPGGTHSESVPASINDAGQVVGLANDFTVIDPVDRPALWRGPGVGVDLGVNPGQNHAAQANGINNHGAIVGANTEPAETAWLLQNGTVTNLPSLPGNGATRAIAINDNGLIVGDALDAAARQTAVTWQNGRITALGSLPGGDFSQVFGVNLAGQAVGMANVTTGGRFAPQHAVLFDHGKVIDLKVPMAGTNSAQANAINNHGQIVGLDATGHGFLYQNGKSVDLNTLIAPTPGVRIASANGINDNGVIVGDAVMTSPRHLVLGFELIPVGS